MRVCADEPVTRVWTACGFRECRGFKVDVQSEGELKFDLCIC